MNTGRKIRMAKLLESILYLTIIQECVMSVNPYKKSRLT
ncbi:hypothetical protein C2W58_03996 [Bacillus pumilus]|uniref:Uncharacterized protein n=1 Tax=Bacillus pumilus TaxID=1408 RepID=A0AB34QZW8_BACPU|nr:hypothetical protein BAT_3824 [Bacillus pumilus ATCC 7061]KIL25307.1 hypothetical protein B4127_0291 [Bacillus pumilus]RAP11088.1 hypothetical protein C2W58_03996 [Bacillus pumilus]